MPVWAIKGEMYRSQDLGERVLCVILLRFGRAVQLTTG
jgi:hypothetical protein